MINSSRGGRNVLSGNKTHPKSFYWSAGALTNSYWLKDFPVVHAPKNVLFFVPACIPPP